MDCQANRDGPNCERCKENFFLRSDGYCINCGCDAVGKYNDIIYHFRFQFPIIKICVRRFPLAAVQQRR